MAPDTATAADGARAPAVEASATPARAGVCGPNPAGLARFGGGVSGPGPTGAVGLAAPPVGAVSAPSRPAGEHRGAAVVDDPRFRRAAPGAGRAADPAAHHRVATAGGPPVVFPADHATPPAVVFADPAGDAAEARPPTGPPDRTASAVPPGGARLPARPAGRPQPPDTGGGTPVRATRAAATVGPGLLATEHGHRSTPMAAGAAR